MNTHRSPPSLEIGEHVGCPDSDLDSYSRTHLKNPNKRTVGR